MKKKEVLELLQPIKIQHEDPLMGKFIEDVINKHLSYLRERVKRINKI